MITSISQTILLTICYYFFFSLSLSVSQITGIIFVSLSQVLVQDISHELHNNQCGVGLSTANSTFCGSSSNSTVSDNSKPGDWTNGGLLLVGMTVIAYILFTLILRPTYKRLEVEKKAKRDKEEREDVFNSVNEWILDVHVQFESRYYF